MNLPKVADEKRIDPKEKTNNKHKKIKYPPHFQVRCWGVNTFHIIPSKLVRGEDKWRFDEGRPFGQYHKVYGYSEEYKQFLEYGKSGNLDKALEIFGKHHPETLTWPVRFIHVAPLDTKREILA